MKRILLSGVFWLVGLVLFPAGAIGRPAIPPPLAPWTSWVMHGHEQELCRSRFDNPREKICAWPGRLHLEIEDNSAVFHQKWRIESESWVSLPGQTLRPQAVTVDGKPLAVVEHQGRPSALLGPGTHQVSGRILWDRLPASIAVDPATVLVSLKRKGRLLDRVDRDRSGRVWLKSRQGNDAEKDSLDLQVFRLIQDDLPLTVITRLKLQVTGRARQERFAGPLLSGFIPMQLTSPLPARLEPDGSLIVQLAPGVWELDLVARHPGPVDRIMMPRPGGQFWPKTELWSFAARPALRLVDLSGLDSVDPSQSAIPAEWRKFPAFIAIPGGQLRLSEKRRGDADPTRDRLKIARTLWLDMDGGGFTFHDQLSGSVNRSPRLSASRIKLGRVAIDGHDQLITMMDGRPGVELRRGELNMAVDGRFERKAHLAAVGWEHDAESLAVTLNLPPGWLLLSSSGVDRVRSWTGRWTLLDIFLVLIITLAAARLVGWPRAGIILFTMLIIYHEPGAPRWLWLNILAAMAVLKVKSDGVPGRVATWWGRVFMFLLILVAVPFMVREVRLAIYPQLEMGQGVAYERPALKTAVQQVKEEMIEAEDSLKAPLPSSVARKMVKGRVMKSAEIAKSPGYGYSLTAYDPGAMIQTGPGLPRWRWHTYHLGWDGPVAAGEEFSLILLPPWLHSMVRGLRSLFLLAMLFILARGLFPDLSLRRLKGATAAMVIMPLLFSAAARAGEIPSAEMLDELRARLVEPDRCRSDCAAIERLWIGVGEKTLTVRSRYALAADRFVPIPLTLAGWRIDEIISDGFPLDAAARGGDGLPLVPLEAGVHEVVFRGPLPRRSTFSVNLPLAPGRVDIKAPGWQVRGIRENGLSEGQLSFARKDRGKDEKHITPGVLPPFLEVERTLKLGLDWRVDTVVRRLSPTGSPVVAAIDLIPGEAVTSAATEVKEDKAVIRLGPEARQASFSSRLAKTEKIKLTAAGTDLFREVWRLSVGPSLHVEHSGLVPVHRRDRRGNWNPVFRPWPGESIELTVSKPAGVPGETLTIDQARITVSPGRQKEETSLTLDLRSSRGGQYLLPLPDKAEVSSFTVNGRSTPLRRRDGRVVIDLVPGERKVAMSYLVPLARRVLYHTPALDLGQPAANLFVRVNMPRDRWLLFCSGPAMGPAVLFWGEIIVILIIALILARLRVSPLRLYEWVLLGLGLSQVPFVMALLVAGWLIALALREKKGDKLSPDLFNLSQVGLVILTVVAMACLFAAIRTGLLGRPDMLVNGNGSSGVLLNWYQDRSGGAMPRPLMVSVPIWVYRVMMLAWALWMARTLIKWLRWGWGVFSGQGLWRQGGALKSRRRESKGDPASGGADDKDLPELIPE